MCIYSSARMSIHVQFTPYVCSSMYISRSVYVSPYVSSICMSRHVHSPPYVRSSMCISLSMYEPPCAIPLPMHFPSGCPLHVYVPPAYIISACGVPSASLSCVFCLRICVPPCIRHFVCMFLPCAYPSMCMSPLCVCPFLCNVSFVYLSLHVYVP